MRPFSIRPEKNVLQNPPKPPPKPPPKEMFSPELAALLSLTMKDGFVNATAFNMLKDIYPYVEQGDAKLIGDMLRAHDSVKSITLAPKSSVLSGTLVRRPLTREERMFGLFRVLSRYGGKNASSTIGMLERAMEMKRRASGDPMKILLETIGGPDAARMAQMMKAFM